MNEHRAHRRSIKAAGNLESLNANIPGNYCPELFDNEDDDVEEMGKRNLYPELKNASWPPAATSISLMEEQEESDVELELTTDFESQSFSKRRSVNIGCRRSLPNERTQSRSRSGQRQQVLRESSDSLNSDSSTSSINYSTLEILQSFWNTFWDNVVQSHSSVFNEYFNFIIWIFIVIVVIFILMFLHPLIISVQQPLPEQQFVEFRKQLRDLIKQELGISNDKREARHDTDRMLVYIADRMLKRKCVLSGKDVLTSERNEQQCRPITLLLASSDAAKANHMAEKYALLLQQSWSDYKVYKHNISSEITRIQLEQQVLVPLQTDTNGATKKGMNVLILLQGIEQLHANAAPLFLHSLVDSESSPLIYTSHNVAIIFSLQLIFEQNSNATKHNREQERCIEMIESTLLNRWKTEMLTEDQIHPIISRISAYSICI